MKMFKLKFLNWQLPIRRWGKRLLMGLAALITSAALGLALLWHLFPLDVKSFERMPQSPRLSDRAGRLLHLGLTPDEQWRDPVPITRMSRWLSLATVAVEDERFYCHPGVDLVGIGRAVLQNLQRGRIVSGASTLTMQLCRIQDPKSRTLSSKLIEAFRALQLDRAMNKDTQLELYLNVAPYGGNLRGVAMASRVYFGKAPKDLNLAESALIAGLPQSPSRYRPDRFPERAKGRRDHVLDRMLLMDMIKPDEYREAKARPILANWYARNRHHDAMLHLSQHALGERAEGGRLTVEKTLQLTIFEQLRAHVADPIFPSGTDASCVVIDIVDGDVLACINSARPEDPWDGQMRGAIAMRSPGSALKPFIYAAAMDAGRLNRHTLLQDVALNRGGWQPRNFDRKHVGSITAEKALQRSLNTPAIHVMEVTGAERCLGVMRAFGFYPPEQANVKADLGLAVGASDVNLLQLTNAYAALGRDGVYLPPRWFLPQAPNTWPANAQERIIGTQALPKRIARAISEMLSSRARFPNEDLPWVCWKTGTSSARRDAWAVGHNGRVAIGVWVGHFSGSRHASFVGQRAAQPLLLQLFKLPELMNKIAPPLPDPVQVYRPMPPPREWLNRFQITYPLDASRLVATETRDGERGAFIFPKASEDGVQWMLNGRMLDTRHAPLWLPIGRHRLSAFAGAGKAIGHDHVAIDVLP